MLTKEQHHSEGMSQDNNISLGSLDDISLDDISMDDSFTDDSSEEFERVGSKIANIENTQKHQYNISPYFTVPPSRPEFRYQSSMA